MTPAFPRKVATRWVLRLSTVEHWARRPIARWRSRCTTPLRGATIRWHFGCFCRSRGPARPSAWSWCGYPRATRRRAPRITSRSTCSIRCAPRGCHTKRWWSMLATLHQSATDDPGRRFDDLWNLVYDPTVLVEAWHRVRSNRGARTAGVDGETAYYVTTVRGEQAFLSELRDQLKTRKFQPLPVRQVTIPKPGTTKRRR